MFHRTSFTLLKVLLQNSSSYRFIICVILSFSFSIAVILGTVGLMDGFDYSLKKALKMASGDLILYSHDGFFIFEHELKPALEKIGIHEFTSLIQTDGFLIHNETSKGVVIKGVDGSSFTAVTGLPINVAIGSDEIILGKDLAELLRVQVGDELTVAFASGDKGLSLLPLLKAFRVKGIVKHGIYRKDIRFVYIDKKYLQTILSVGEHVNIVSANISRPFGEGLISSETIQRITDVQERLQSTIGLFYKIRPFWQEFSSLIEAVKIQKFVIGLIFQLIVLISIFNLMAFIVYLNEKRSQEIFLFEALGMGKKRIWQVWFSISFILWGFACIGAYFFVQFFAYGLTHFSFLRLPGDIYNLSELTLRLTPLNYFLVDGLALVWVLCMMLIVVFRFRKKSILQGLRKEFS